MSRISRQIAGGAALGAAILGFHLMQGRSRELMRLGGGTAPGDRVFTRWHLPVTDTSELESAISRWVEAGPPVEPAAVAIIERHVAIDALLFTPAYCLLAFVMLICVRARKARAAFAALLMFLIDEIENGATYSFIAGLSSSHESLVTVQALTLLKWAVLLSAGVYWAWLAGRWVLRPR
jgi:hypothetical protein